MTSGTGRQRCARGQRGAQQAAAEEEPGQREEDVDAAGDPAEPDVEDRDERDRDAAKAVEIVPVEARRAGAHRRRAGLGADAVAGAGRAGARVNMVDGQST